MVCYHTNLSAIVIKSPQLAPLFRKVSKISIWIRKRADSVLNVKGFLQPHHSKMDAYNTKKAHQAAYTVRALSPTLHRITLGHLFLETSQDTIFHGNADRS